MRAVYPIAGVVALIAGAALLGRTGAVAPGADSGEAVRISERVYRFGNVVVDRQARTVTCPGRVNMREGPIEYLAVTPEGKIHESVLTLDVVPHHLQVGLIFLELEPKGGVRFQGDPSLPRGPLVRIDVAWEHGGKRSVLPAEQLVWDRPKRRPMPPNAWIFSGSLVRDGVFLADEEKSLIAVFRDAAAIINNRLPEGADDTVYDANSRVLPPVGTPVELVVRAPAASRDRK